MKFDLMKSALLSDHVFLSWAVSISVFSPFSILESIPEI